MFTKLRCKMKSVFLIRRGIGKKITLLFLLCMVVVLFLGCVLFNNVLMSSVNKMENVYVQDSISKIENAYNQELKDIQLMALAWGPWHNMFNPYQEPGSREADEYQMKMEFESKSLNMMLITDTSGNVLYGKTMDLNTEQMFDIPPEVLNWFSVMRMLNNKDPQKTFKGVINLGGVPMLVASGTVETYGADSKMVGNVFFGRYFNDSVLSRLSTQLNYNMDMQWLGGTAFSNLDATGDSYGYLTQIIPRDQDTILGIVAFPDINHYAALQITVFLARDIHQMGTNASFLSIIMLAVLFGAIFVLLLFSINRVVLHRLAGLDADVERVEQNRSFSERVRVGGSRDEITSLSARVNGMLDVMEDLHETVRTQNDALEKTVRQRTQELVEANAALSREKERIKHIAYHDTLTGLPNGTYLSDYLNYQVSSSLRNGDPMAVFFLDLDGFKIVNDTLGHAAGDQILIQVAKRLGCLLRRSDFISRIGGDEFVILINSVSQRESVEVIAQKILECILEPFCVMGQECFMSTSIGIAFCPQDGKSSQELLKNADMALYRAKSEGRNQVCYCTDELKNRIRENMLLSNQMWRALEKEEFELYYQPQIACETGRIAGLEALIRWNHPERGLVMPQQFISLAEQTGAIMPMGLWVLRQACIQCRKWQDEFGILLRMGVNVSIKQLQTPEIVSQVQAVLQETGLGPGSLELEITENILLREVSYALNILNSLKALGVLISIDDFGTEYASLNYLKHMPVDRIKIAMPFVQGLDESEKDQAITRSLIFLAKSMGLSVIAEGVETETQLDFLTNRMCDETQGFYLYRPMPAQEIEKLLRGQSQKKMLL